MSSAGFIEITKMEAAERQLATAIRLFFRKEDPFSIHTLIGAATGILDDLAKKVGIKNPFTDAEYIKSEMKKEYFHLLRKGRNFLKHAKKDSEATLEINPDVNKFSIVEGLHLYEQLNKSICGECYFYRIWFVYNHPDLFNLHYDIKDLIANLSSGMITPNNMNDFQLITEVLDMLKGKKFPSWWKEKE
jgi:hypothetical protein